MFLCRLIGVVLALSAIALATLENKSWNLHGFNDPNAPYDPNTPNDPNTPDDPNNPEPVLSQIQNGGFELADPNSPMPFAAPLNWMLIGHPENDYEGSYAEIVGSFKPELKQWKIPHAYKNENFVLLSTGGYGFEPNAVSDGQVRGSRIAQKVFILPGDTIIGAYFFGTFDYRPYNDWGRIYLELAEPNSYPNSQPYFEIPNSVCDVNTVGSYQSTFHLAPESDGWMPFTYTVEPNQLGPYYITCEVVDLNDAVYESFYAVDNLWICRGGKPATDFTEDCNVNLEDFTILSEAWYSWCPDVFDPNTMDPNDIADPNIPCQLADLDNSWLVDPNDLIIFAEDWLSVIFNSN